MLIYYRATFLCYTCLVLSDDADVLDCFGTLIIRQSLSAVPVGLRYPHARHVSYLTPIGFQIFLAITN